VMKVNSLSELCLEVMLQKPQECLFEDGEDDDREMRKSRRAVLHGLSVKKENNVADIISSISRWTLMWENPSIREDWREIRREEMFEVINSAAKSNEIRPQIVWSLAERGRLLDGSLPCDFWEGLRCDTLSLAGSRAGPEIISALVKAQSIEPRLISIDLSSCLLIDDNAVSQLAKTCGSILQRLGLRDCRKITNTIFDLVIQDLPRLIDLDISGDFNVTVQAATINFVRRLNTIIPPKKKRSIGRPPKRQRISSQDLEIETTQSNRAQFLALGISGLGVDDDFLMAAATELTSIRQIGIAYGHFSSNIISKTFQAWPHLIDLRVQWTPSFDDFALDALAAHCPRLTALDATGTPITIDAIRRLIHFRGPYIDDAVLDLPPIDPTYIYSFPTFQHNQQDHSRHLSWFSCRYTNGPKASLQKISSAYAAVTSHIRIVLK